MISQVFTVYVSVVNLNHSRGAQIANTFYNSVLTVGCGAQSDIDKVGTLTIVTLMLLKY